jgi:hypothetical protein
VACTAPSIIPPFPCGRAAVLTEAIKMEKPVEEQVRIRAHELWERLESPIGEKLSFGTKPKGK